MATYDWFDLTNRLSRSLRVETTPVGLKFLKDKSELASIPKVRVHKKRFSPCMIIGQAVQFGWTAACLAENVHSDYCRGIHGMFERDEKWYSGEMFSGVWFDKLESSAEHNRCLTCAPPEFQALVASPLSSGRIDEPDVCVLYLNSAQLFLLLCGFQYSGYEKLEFSFAGESTCSDSWIRTLTTGKIGVSIPCFAERKFGGVTENQMVFSSRPGDLLRAAEGVESLAKNGLRYPIAPYSLTTDMMAGLPESYLGF